jgi:hypothetical protein
MAKLTFRDGFEPMRLNWGGPDESVSDKCSYCDAPIAEDDIPLRMWRDDGWAIVLCDDCAARWVTIS